MFLLKKKVTKSAENALLELQSQENVTSMHSKKMSPKQDLALKGYTILILERI